VPGFGSRTAHWANLVHCASGNRKSRVITAQFQNGAFKNQAVDAGLGRRGGAKRLLIPRLRGMEDSSRNWSVWMTLDHLRIIHGSFIGVIGTLVKGVGAARQSEHGGPSNQVKLSLPKLCCLRKVLRRPKQAGGVYSRPKNEKRALPIHGLACWMPPGGTPWPAPIWPFTAPKSRKFAGGLKSDGAGRAAVHRTCHSQNSRCSSASIRG